MFQYIKPGAKRVVSASGHTDILLTTWKNDVAHGDNLVMVVMNKGNSALTMNITQADLPADYTVYRCSEEVARFQDGKYTKGDKLLLAPRSIVTLVSGYKATPTINQVASQLYMNDGLTKTISLSGITDGNTTNANPITITYTQTNPSVISNVALSYTTPATTGSFSFKPAALGITQITMSVTAGGVTTTMKFNIEVKTYSAPNINPVVAAASYDVGSGAKSLPLAGINDGDDGSQTLTVTAAVTTSNPTGVITGLGVVYTSPQTTGTLNFTPAKVGTAEVTVTVVDNGPAGSNTTTTKFTIVVHDHFKPVITAIKDTTVKVGAFINIPLKYTNGGDADTFTVVTATSSNEAVTDKIYLSAKKDFMTFVPKAKGTGVVTITVTDAGPAGKNTSTLTFTVTVTSSGISLERNADAISLYPNPVFEHLTVEISQGSFKRWKIVSANGMLVQEGTITSWLIEIGTADLASGSYTIILEGDDDIVSKQFIRK